MGRSIRTHLKKHKVLVRTPPTTSTRLHPRPVKVTYMEGYEPKMTPEEIEELKTRVQIAEDAVYRLELENQELYKELMYYKRMAGEDDATL